MSLIPSPTYPYEHIQQYNRFQGAEEIPRQVINYLMDMPLPGYTPPDSDEYPRARLMKYLYYDTEYPLRQPLPTPAQKLDILFDASLPTHPDNKRKLYRIFPQQYIAQAQTLAATTLYVHMGQSIAKGSNLTELSVVFEIMTNVNYESNAGNVASRTWAMECALLEALNGVNLNGIGTFYFDRTQHPSCGSWDIGDRGTNVGRQVVIGLSWHPECGERLCQD